MAVNRRQIVQAVGLGAMAAGSAGADGRRVGRKLSQNYPFPLGVASGDPVADGFVLWTRVAPDPFDPEFLGNQNVLVEWQLATDEHFRRVVRTGQVCAYAQYAHSVHVDLHGLAPATTYFYRFIVDGVESPVGRANTTRPVGMAQTEWRVGVCSCQSYTDGYYAAYRDLVSQQPDVILHLGDYIYETPWVMPARRMPTPEAISLDDYRLYHAVTKLDADLQAAHAVAPWIVTWDDHEVANDYRGAAIESAKLAQRRAAAYQAYYEHMPIRRGSFQANPGRVQMYRRHGFGDLVQLDVLDTRQFRSGHPCSRPLERSRDWVNCEPKDPDRSMLGVDQEAWLGRGFAQLGAKWNVIAQTTQLTQYERVINGENLYAADRWDGYPQARQRLIDTICAASAKNVLILGGDIHAFRTSPVRDASGAVAKEWITGAISSGGGGDERYRAEVQYLRDREDEFYFENRQNGYLLITFTTASAVVSVRATTDVRDPNAKLSQIYAEEIPAV